jgi:6-pyruvoyltetrahydropterin/6-carboxytetrahydropterin synthase
MEKFKSTKLFDGYSACFRQWKADGTHCRFLHGYAVSFRVWFEGELDHRNWVFDFGGMKRAKTTIGGMSPKEFFDHMLDHTTIVAVDDPYLDLFQTMQMEGLCKLVIMDKIGAESAARMVYEHFNEVLSKTDAGRCKCIKVECFENDNNSSIYEEI